MHDTLLLFGATGDLAVRMLFPSIAHLLRDRLLPADFRVIAIGRQDYTHEAFRDWLGERMPALAGKDLRDGDVAMLLPRKRSKSFSFPRCCAIRRRRHPAERSLYHIASSAFCLLSVC